MGALRDLFDPTALDGQPEGVHADVLLSDDATRAERPRMKPSPFVGRKSLVFRVKSDGKEGTCKQGERSDLTGCTPDGGPSGDTRPARSDSDVPSTSASSPKEAAAWEQYDADHAEWKKECEKLEASYEKEHTAWEKETDKLLAQYEDVREKWDKETDDLRLEFEKEHSDWEKRGEERQARREALEEDCVQKASDALRFEPPPGTVLMGGGYSTLSYEDYAKQYVTNWDVAYGEKSEFVKQLAKLKLPEKALKKMTALVEKGTAVIEKTVAKYAKTVAKYEKAVAVRDAFAEKMPEEPVEPDGFDENDQEDEARYDREYAEYEKAVEKYEALEEKHLELSDLADELSVEVDTASEALEEAFSEHEDSLKEAVEAAKAPLLKELDDEEEDDVEPEEPDYPDEPEEPDYPDEPEEPDYPDEPEEPDADRPQKRNGV